MIEKIFSKVLNKIPKVIKIAFTFLVTNALWVLFRAESFDKAIGIYSAMLNFKNISFDSIAPLAADGIMGLPSLIATAYVTGLIAIALCVVFFTKNVVEKSKEFKPTTRNMLITAAALVLSVLFISRESVFIYFNF